jgi:hypothetical protein
LLLSRSESLRQENPLERTRPLRLFSHYEYSKMGGIGEGARLSALVSKAHGYFYTDKANTWDTKST